MLNCDYFQTARCIAAAKIEALEAEQSGISAIEEWNLKLADVLVLLGEHGISDGKYTQAFEDLDRALNIQRNVLPPSSRKIAQTYILIGNACASDANYDETVQYFGKTKDVLIARQTELKHELERGVDDKEKKSEFENELKELEEMMPGVEEMIADAVHSAAQVEETKKAIKAQFEGFTQVLAKLPQEAGDQKEANDISSLVRFELTSRRLFKYSINKFPGSSSSKTSSGCSNWQSSSEERKGGGRNNFDLNIDNL